MIYPKIKNIKDVLPYIEGKKEYKVIEKDGYVMIMYMFVNEDTFKLDNKLNPYLLECRGIKFNEHGEIIVRPFHKFFNIGEKKSVEDIDFSRQHSFLHKLDGSLIHPVYEKGDIKLMTKLGFTEVSQKAEKYLTEDIKKYCADEIKKGNTPLFEYISPDNRIVINYDKGDLVLLANRNNISGNYLSIDNINLIRKVGYYQDKIHSSFNRDLYNEIKQHEFDEGTVILFENGEMYKLKSDHYVNKHKVISNIKEERHVLLCFLEDTIDDMWGIMDKQDKVRINEYIKVVTNSIIRFADISYSLLSNKEKDKKYFVDLSICCILSH